MRVRHYFAFFLLPTSNKIKNESKDQFNNVFGLYIVGLRVLCTNLAKLDVTEYPKKIALYRRADDTRAGRALYLKCKLSIHAPDPITY